MKTKRGSKKEGKAKEKIILMLIIVFSVISLVYALTFIDNSSSISETQQVYDLGTLDSEKSAEVIDNDVIKFTLSGTKYTILLQSSSQTQATLAISSLSNPVTINVGKTQTIDLNSDGNSDISIKVKSINIISKKVKLVLTP